VVQTIKSSDTSLTCNQIEMDMAEAERFRVSALKEKGVTGTNVVAFLFFWPAMIGTYANANEAISAADNRKAYLANISLQKKCNEKGLPTAVMVQAQPVPASAPPLVKEADQKLVELKSLLDKGLISKDDYWTTRNRIIREL